jgi:hypothetical protein
VNIEQRLREVLSSHPDAEQQRHFFERLKNPKLLPYLERMNIFANPPETVKRGNVTYYPTWPPAEYLNNIAAIAPADVTRIILGLGELPPGPQLDIINVIKKLPAPFQAASTGVVARWLAGEHRDFLIYAVVDLVDALFDAGEDDSALDLIAALTALKRNEEAPHDTGWRIDDAIAVIGDDDLAYVLEHLCSKVPDRMQLRVGVLLADRLDDALRIEKLDKTADDLSATWFRELNEDGLGVGAKENLASAIIRIQTRLIDRPGDLTALMSDFAVRKLTVFGRLLLAAGALRPQSLRLISVLRDRAFLHRVLETDELPDALAAWANVSDQVEVGPVASALVEIAEMRASALPFTDRDAADRYKAALVIRLLSPLRAKLDAALSSILEKAKMTATEADAESINPRPRSWIGPTSPLSEEQLAGRTVEDVTRFAMEWIPPTGFMVDSAAGLSRAIERDVQQRAVEYLTSGAVLKLDPVYLYGVVGGLESSALEPSQSELVLDFVNAVFTIGRTVEIERQRITAKSSGPDEEDIRSHWPRSLRARSALLISNLFQRGFFREQSRKFISLLSSMLRDTDPDELADVHVGLSRSPLDPAVNSVRGCAAITLISTLGHNRVPTIGPADQVANELDLLLESLIDPYCEKSPIVRAVLGASIRQIYWWSPPEFGRRISMIFASEPLGSALRDAAWASYLVYGSPHQELFPYLRPLYESAVLQLKIVEDGAQEAGQNERIAEHVAMLLWSLQIDASDSLSKRFFATANSKLVSSALWRLGRSMEIVKDARQIGVARDVIRLVLNRAEEGKQSLQERRELLKAFGWWYVSDALPPSEALQLLEEVLRLTKGRVSAEHRILERLVRDVSAYPELASRCLRWFIRGGNPFMLLEVKRHARAILTVAIEAGGVSRGTAVEINDMLEDMGVHDFHELFLEL